MSIADSDFDSPAVWPDLYALLEIAPDADTSALRARIRQAYMEAVTNADHRNIQRRDYYEMMGQRIVPQAQRILLDDRTRRAYDRQLALHRASDAAAIPYPQFVARLAECETDEASNANEKTASALLPSRETDSSDSKNDSLLEAPPARAARAHPTIIDALLPTSTAETAPSKSSTRSAPASENAASAHANANAQTANAQTANAQSLFEKAHEVLRSEKKYAEMAPLPSLQDGENDANANAKDKAPTSAPPDLSALSPGAFVTDAPFFDELPISTAVEPSREPRKTLFPPSSTRSRPTSADTKVRVISHEPTAEQSAAPQSFFERNVAPQNVGQQSVTPQSVASGNVASGNVASQNVGSQAVAAPESASQTVASSTVASSTVAAPHPSDTQSVNANSEGANAPLPTADANVKIERAGAEVPILARVPSGSDADVADAGAASEPSSLGGAEMQARAAWAAAQARAVETDAGRAIPQKEPADVSLTPEENEARRARVLRVERGARPLTTSQLESSGGQDLGAGFHGIVSSGRETAEAKPSRTRIRIEEGQKLRRTLPQTTRFALTAFLSAGLMFLILRLQNGNKNDAIAPPAPPALHIEYSNELQPVLQSAQSLFAKTPSGRGLGFDLRPADSQIAMRAVLDGQISPEAWIPRETFWSERFNRGAARKGLPPLGETRSLAMSPLVLVARDDKAAPLLRRFPDRFIASWDALHSAIAASAPGHFGLNDPQKTGAGALVRLFMAREWCKRNNVAWNENALSDKGLWNWMNGFESNVPDYGDSLGATIQDLVVGNSDRYWWAIGYESDAIKWLKAGKPIQIFYLPQTAFAEYPFCAIERKSSSTRIRQARADFQAFLRSREVQIVLAQNGFRPTEIRLADVPDNPFRNAKWRARGLRENGLRVDQRFNLELLDAITSAWKARN